MMSRPFSIPGFFFVVFVLGTFYIGSAQSFYALKIDRRIRSQAVDITSKYQPRLVMGIDQALEFQQVVAKFLVKKRSVETDPTLSPGAKYYLLRKISSRETSEMADVLESYRWQEYMRIKSDIQPIPKPPSDGQDLIVHEEFTNQ